MKRLMIVTLFFTGYLLFTIQACTNDELPPPGVVDCDSIITYIGEIKAIIDNSCAYDGCHVAGFSSGDFTTYEKLLPFTESGEFTNRVIAQRSDPNNGMPPNNAPADKPEDLTPEEIQLVECWIADGFAKN